MKDMGMEKIIISNNDILTRMNKKGFINEYIKEAF